MRMVTTGTNDDSLKLVPHFPIAVLRIILEQQEHTTTQDIAFFDELIGRGIPPLVNPKFFAYILGVSPKLIYAMVHVPSRYYRTFAIPKRTGGTRTISSPRVFLKAIQKWLMINVLYKRSLPGHVTGFTPHKSILDNATFHVGKQHLVRIDIEDFFPSIGLGEVETIFRSFGYKQEVVNLLSRLTLLNGELPQGAPTSPYLANLVFLPSDETIEALATERNITYSRYADDLTFSSDEPFDGDFLLRIENVIGGAGFRINREKFLKVGKGQRHITTGFVVNEKVHPSRTFRRRLRAKFHEAADDPQAFQKDYHRMQGWAAYVNMYDKELGQSYLAIARKIPQPSSRK
jgi:RNA-directed DNA polymerase